MDQIIMEKLPQTKFHNLNKPIILTVIYNLK